MLPDGRRLITFEDAAGQIMKPPKPNRDWKNRSEMMRWATTRNQAIVCAAPSYCAQFFRYAPHSASAAFAAIVALGPPDELKADCVAASRVASMSSMGLFAPIGGST